MDESKEIFIEEREIHLRDYLRVIQKRKYVALLFFVVTVVLVTLVTIRAIPIYQASTQLLVEKNESTSVTGRAYYNSYDPEFYETQYQLIKSQSVSRKVVKQLDLENNWERYFPKNEDGLFSIGKIKATIKGWVTELIPSSSSGKATVSTAIPVQERPQGDIFADNIRSGIIVTPVKESRIINIKFQSSNPDFARLIANTIAEAYKEEIMAIQMNSSGYALQWMTKKADEERSNLAKSEKALQVYMKQQNIVTIEDKVAILPQQLSTLTAKLAEAQAKKRSLENIYKQMAQALDGGETLDILPSMVGNNELLNIGSQIRATEQKVSELSQKYGPKHPVMIEARTELRDVNKHKKREISKIIASVKSELDIATFQEESIRLSMAELKQDALTLNEKLTEYRILKRDVDTNRAMYDALVMQAKEKGVTESTQKVNVWTTQIAETPTSPIKPNVKRNLLLAIVLGLFGGVGISFFVEYLDNTVKDTDDLEDRFGVSVLGVVEMLKKQNPDSYAESEPSSSFAESYKSLRTALLLSAADNPPKRIMVCSMSPQEGKTTTALNLARAVAQTERKVLLIDADLRRPRLHKALGISNSNKGLSNMLSGTVEHIEIDNIGDTGLSILTSGAIPPNPSELLGSRSFATLLSQLENDYDMIIIDSPPVLSATDAVVLSDLVEGVLVVCKYGETTYERVEKGLQTFTKAGSKVIGLLINAMDMKKSNYYSYYGYYQYYSADNNEK